MQGYRGYQIPITFGPLGLQSDMSAPASPPFSLLLAENVNVRYGAVSRSPGSIQWNQSALPAPIVSFCEFWPDDTTQRVIACCSDGKVYKFINPYSYSEVSSSDGNNPVLTFGQNPVMVQAGAEGGGTLGVSATPRKLFIFSGHNQVQVISGDSNTRADIALPALDWTTTAVGGSPPSYPTTGIVSNHFLRVTGCNRFPDMVYDSNPNNHEDFQTNGAVAFTNVFPGEHQGNIGFFAYKTRCYVLKKPQGLYYIDDSGTSPVPYKIGDSFGGVAPSAAQEVLDDMLIANSAGSISSLKAVFSLGQTEQGDLLKQLGCSKFLRESTSQVGMTGRQMIYYEDKKQVFTTFSSTGYQNDRLLVIDHQATNPCVYWYTKDSPTCLSMMQDVLRVKRPHYGASDGFIYSLDSPMCHIGTIDNGSGNTAVGYLSRFQTPDLDFNWVFGGLQTTYQERDKQFDFVGVTCESRGNWTINCDVLVNGAVVRTLTFPMGRSTFLDGEFPLDEATTNGPFPNPYIQPIG